MVTDAQLHQALANAQKTKTVQRMPKPIKASSPSRSRIASPEQVEALRIRQEQAKREGNAAKWAKAIPPRYADRRLSDFIESRQQVGRAFVAGRWWAMYLYSSVPGCGKTSFAVATGYEWMGEHGTAPTFMPAYQAARQLRNLDKCRPFVERIVKVPLLIIDDIGVNRSTPHVVEQLLSIINERYDFNRPTIITSNLTAEEFGKQLDPWGRASSRLKDGRVLQMQGEDRRGNLSESPATAPVVNDPPKNDQSPV